MTGGRIRPGSVRPKFADGLISLVSGMGTTTDPRTYQRYHAHFMSDHEIDQAYRGSWVMRKAIDKPAREMVREWRDWQADSDDIAKLEAEERRLNLRGKVEQAERLAGLGGAGLVLYVGGSVEEQARPLDPARVQSGSLRTIHVWHRSRFSLGEMISDWESPWFGEPSYYEIQLGSQRVRFHPSRVVPFKADPVADIISTDWQSAFWGQARVQTIIDAVQNVDAADTGFAALIKDARNRRIYIPKLLDMVATADGESRLARRLQAFALGESSNAVSWLDGGDGQGNGAEKIEDRQMNWAGMPDIMASYRMAAAAAADMPATVMWGQSPQGMNATGASDIELWHKTIRGKQDLDLRPCMTRIDSVLIPSALGRVDDDIWYEWAPLATQSEKDEATTFFTTAQAVEKFQATGAIPEIAFEKAVQNLLEERGWIPGLGDALAELPDDERFPSLSEPDLDDDPSALQAGGQQQPKGGDPSVSGRSGGANEPASARRVSDAWFEDATPRPLYVQRKLLNAGELIAWAKDNGFETTLPAGDMHVTVLYSRAPVDPMKMGRDWREDEQGRITVRPGGPRAIERLGENAVVLRFACPDLDWRHRDMVEAGGSHDYDEYQPHVTLTYSPPDGLDLEALQPFPGKLVFGPEVFQPLDLDWKSKVSEE